MRIKLGSFALLMLLVVHAASALTLDELIAKNIEARGGLDKIHAIQSIRFTGKLRFGSSDLPYVVMMKRPEMLRTEFTLQGMTAIQAYDGKEAWRIAPFRGRVDPEKMAALRVVLHAVFGQHFGEHPDGSKRGLQFVRDVADEVGLLAREPELAVEIGHDEPASHRNGENEQGDEETEGQLED